MGIFCDHGTVGPAGSAATWTGTRWSAGWPAASWTRWSAGWPATNKPIWRIGSLDFRSRTRGYAFRTQGRGYALRVGIAAKPTTIWFRKSCNAFESIRSEHAGQTAVSYSTIQFHPGPRLASIVLDRPPLNIIDVQMLHELHDAWAEVEDLNAQVTVISGAGDRAFSAGVHVADHVPGKVETMINSFHHLVLRIRKSQCITIAAIHGYTLGGGAELAMMCDLVLAADDTQFGQPEISLACYPPVAVAHLPQAVGLHRASEMILLGEPITASEAERFGLVNKVVPRASLNATVDTYADKLLAKSSVVLALTKRAIREGAGHDFERALERSKELYLYDLIKTEDMIEGMKAFLEKRPPSWNNK